MSCKHASVVIAAALTACLPACASRTGAEQARPVAAKQRVTASGTAGSRVVPTNGHRQQQKKPEVVVAKVERKAIEAPTPRVSANGNGAGSAHTQSEPEEPARFEHKQAYPIPPPKAAAPPDAKTAARARKLIQRGRVHYRKGEYEQAEVLLREAAALYPFIAEANLMLGKIFLIRGSALRDRALVNSARLMFEMARALDPSLREPAVLLELFLEQPPE